MTKEVEMHTLLGKLNDLERHMVNILAPLDEYIRFLDQLAKNPIKIEIDRVEEIVSKLNRFCLHIETKLKHIDVSQVFGEIKYIGQRLINIENFIEKLSKDGVDKHIELSFNVDGYDLVKKPKGYDPTDIEASRRENLNKLLAEIPEINRTVLINYFGFYGQRTKTLAEIDKILGCKSGKSSILIRETLNKIQVDQTLLSLASLCGCQKFQEKLRKKY